MRLPLLIFALIVLVQCSSKKSDNFTFEGNYIIGDHTQAIVIPLMNDSYEIDCQIFGAPEIFYLKEIDSDSNYYYHSEDESLSLIMKSNHLEGTFYEINEPPASFNKEK